ncbi:hypothetical protein ACLOJK_026592 [Asimina triloba]
MGGSVPIERDHFVDLECGRTVIEGQQLRDPVPGDGQTKGLFGRVWGRGVSFDGSLKGENLCDVFLNSAEVNVGKVDALAEANLGAEENVCVGEKSVVKEKPKKKRCKKPPKPPRPPNPPMLDATDQKLVREITELAMLKRARIERIKALKKMKAAKATYSGANTCALVITIIFCLVIIFQETTGGLISIQYSKNASAGSIYSASSGSPK